MLFPALGTVILVIDILACLHCWTGWLACGPKVGWTIVIMVFPILGPLAYLFFGRTTRR